MIARLVLLINLITSLMIFDAITGYHLSAGELRYYLLDNTPTSTATDLKNLTTSQAKGFMGNKLSAVYSDDNTKVLIKVPDADSDIRDYIKSNFTILDVYTKYNHKEILKMFRADPNWSNTITEEE